MRRFMRGISGFKNRVLHPASTGEPVSSSAWVKSESPISFPPAPGGPNSCLCLVGGELRRHSPGEDACEIWECGIGSRGEGIKNGAKKFLCEWACQCVGVGGESHLFVVVVELPELAFGAEVESVEEFAGLRAELGCRPDREVDDDCGRVLRGAPAHDLHIHAVLAQGRCLAGLGAIQAQREAGERLPCREHQDLALRV